MSVPILLSPPDGRTVPTRTPRLSWTPVMDSTTNGDVQEYRVEIDKDPGFSMPQRWAGGNESTVWSVPLSVGIYRWRASAIYEMPADSTAGWSDIFTFVTRENSPPQAVGLPDEVRIDEDTVDEPILDLGETFIDEDGDELELSIIGTVNISVTLRGDGVALATPVPDFFGSEEVTLVALERYGIEPVLVLLRITVANLNDPPRINATPATSVDEDALYWSPFMAVHPDPPEDVVSWAVETSAAFLTMDPSSGALSGTPLNDDVGLHDVTVIATDASGSSDRLDFTLEVVDVNDPPMIVTVPVLECRQDEPYSVQFEAVDVDPTNDTVRWELGDGPRFLSMVSYSGLLSGIPGQDDVGSHLVEIIARDDRGAMDLVSFTLIVTDVNDPPRVRDIGPLFLMADILNTLDIADYVSDDETPDGELVVTIDHPAVAGVDGTTIALLWPTNGDFDITIRVSDGCSTVEGRLMVHFIGGENGPPRIIAIDGLDPPFVLTLDRGGTRAFKIDVVDDEGDTYNISVTSSWWGVSLEKHDMLRATSSGWDVGEHLVVIWVVDERMNAARYEATVNVVIKNSPPAVPIIESPLDGSTFRESEEISFSVVVDDPDVRYGQTLWVNWSSSISGPFMRTDSGLNVFKRDLPPGTHTITVEVSDGEFSRNASVTITITRSHIVGQGAWAVLVVLAIIATVAVCVVVWRRMLFGRPPRQGGVGPGDQVPSPPSQGSTGPWEQIR